MLKSQPARADARHMLWLLAILFFWSAGSAMALGLCVMARRGDEAEAALHAPAVEALPVDVPWFATLGEPVGAPTPTAPARSTARY